MRTTSFGNGSSTAGRVSRRTILRLLATSCASLGALAACGGAASSSPTTAGTSPSSAGSPKAAASTGSTAGSRKPAPNGAAKPAGSSSGAPGASSDLATVKFGYNPILAGAPIYFAQDHGYFEQAGLRVEFTPFDSAALMTAPIAAGQLDAIPAAPTPGLFNALARGVKLKAVAPMSSTNATLLVRQDLHDSGQVKKVADLKGKRVSLNVEGSPVDYAVRNILFKSGLTLKDVDLQRVVNADATVAFSNKALDAGVASEPISTLIVQKKLAAVLANSKDYIGDQTGSFLTFGPSFLNRTDDVPQRFLSAYLKGYHDYLNAITNGKMTKAADLQIMSKWTKIAPAVIATVPIPAPPADARIDSADVSRQQDFWKSQGVVKNPVDLSKVIDYHFASLAASSGK